MATQTLHILCIAGPTASGKSSRAVEEALARAGEVISVDSRQVYRGLDIGTEKISADEMRGVPHHLIDIRDVTNAYSAGDFVKDASRCIEDIASRGKLPILAGGTHFYFDALLYGLPDVEAPDAAFRTSLESYTDEELLAQVAARDPRRAAELDPQNRRRIVRALEIIARRGVVPEREKRSPHFTTEWIVIDPPREELRPRIDARLSSAFERGLMEEVARVAAQIDVEQLNELGLEYRIVGEYLRGERTEDSLVPALRAKLWHYARRQKAWLRKLEDELTVAAV